MKRFFSILLAGMMLAQMTAFAAPEAEVAETAQETVSEVQTGAELNAEDYGYPFPNFSLDMSSQPEGVANEIIAGKVSDSLTTFGTLVVKDENANDGYALKIYPKDAVANTAKYKYWNLRDDLGGTEVVPKYVSDPNFTLSVNIPIKNVSKLVIRAKLESDYGGRWTQPMQVFYATDSENWFDGGRVFETFFPESTDNYGKYHELTYDFSAIDKTNANTLTQIRIDPFNDLFDREKIYIDSIVFYSSEEIKTIDLSSAVFSPANGSQNVDYRTRKVSIFVPGNSGVSEETFAALKFKNNALSYTATEEDFAGLTAVFGINTGASMVGKTFTAEPAALYLDETTYVSVPKYSISFSSEFSHDGENLVPNGDFEVNGTNTFATAAAPNQPRNAYSEISNGVLTLGEFKNYGTLGNWSEYLSLHLCDKIVKLEHGTKDEPKPYYIDYKAGLNQKTLDSWEALKKGGLYDKNGNKVTDFAKYAPRIMWYFPEFNGAYSPNSKYFTHPAYIDAINSYIKSGNINLELNTGSADRYARPAVVWDYGDSARGDAGICMQLVLEGGPLYLDAEKTKPAVLDSLLYDFEYLTVKEMFEIKFDANGAEGEGPVTSSDVSGSKVKDSHRMWFAKDVAVTLPDNVGYTMDGAVFGGWQCGDKIYQPGESVTFTEAGRKTLKAIWKFTAKIDETSCSVRFDPTGIRFISEISSLAGTDSAVTEYGYIVARTELLGNNELTFDFKVDGVKSSYVSEKAFDRASGLNKYFDIDNNTLMTKIAVSVIGIPQASANKQLTVRTYTKYGDETVYGQSVVTSLAKICHELKNDSERYDVLTVAQKEEVDKYASMYNA